MIIKDSKHTESSHNISAYAYILYGHGGQYHFKNDPIDTKQGYIHTKLKYKLGKNHKLQIYRFKVTIICFNYVIIWIATYAYRKYESANTSSVGVPKSEKRTRANQA